MTRGACFHVTAVPGPGYGFSTVLPRAQGQPQPPASQFWDETGHRTGHSRTQLPVQWSHVLIRSSRG